MKSKTLDQLKSDYGRYLAIRERQKISANHGLLEMFHLQDEFLKMFPNLLQIADNYKELLIRYAELDASRFDMGVPENTKEKANKKIEEVLLRNDKIL